MKRLITFGRKVARHWPLTPAGLALALLAVWAFLTGRRQMDLVLTLAGVFLLSILLVTFLAALTAVWLLKRNLSREAGRSPCALNLVEGCPADSGLSCTPVWIPFSARPVLRWTRPKAEAGFSRRGSLWVERITPGDRFLGTEVFRDLSQSDILGLWRFRGQLEHPQTVEVLPAPGRLDSAEILSCLISGDLLSFPWGPPRGDLLDFRPYTRSDPARLILWKVFARTRQLLVRTPEQARSPDIRPLLFFVTDEEDRAAAGIARLLIETGVDPNGLRFATDGHPDPTSDREEALAALCRSVDWRDRGGAGLEAALNHPEIGSDDPVILITPASRSLWVSRLKDRVVAGNGRFVILAAGDAAPPLPRLASWKRWLFAPPTPSTLTLPALTENLRPFLGKGLRVILADRAGGRVQVLDPGLGTGLADRRSA